MNLEEQVLTVAEAAKLLRVSPRTYYAAAARGEVPVTKIGRRLVVSGSALLRFLDGPANAFPLETSAAASHLWERWQEPENRGEVIRDG